MAPNLIALAVPLFFVGIGIELWAARRSGRSVYRLGDALADMSCGIAQQVGNVFHAAALLAVYGFVYKHCALIEWPVAVQWVLALVGVDFVFYWWHRLSHEVNFLWAAHVVHHHSEDYNLAVALRQSVTTGFTIFPFYAVLAVVGVPPIPLAVSSALSTLYQFWIHTQLVGQLGPLEGIINTPSAHRVHHAINPKYLDRNHGATFIVWDRLFGTYQREEEPAVFGTTLPLNSYNPLWAQLENYLYLFRVARRAPSLSEALQVFFRSPGWWPRWMGEKPSGRAYVPELASKYDPKPAPPVRRYVFWNLVAMLTGTFFFLLFSPQMSLPQQLAGASMILLTTFALTALWENRPWAKRLELGRWAMLVPSVAVFVLGSG